MAVEVAVLGYASADRAVAVPALPASESTAIVRRRLSRPWPRLGGCGPQIARRLALEGVAAACVSWVAADEPGGRLRADLREAGVDIGGVALAGTRTAESFIAYADDGGSVCFFDPGDGRPTGLDAAQRDAVAAAATVCLTVAPREATRDALACVAPGARVVWSVKADADAYPPELVAALLARADVVALSRGEVAFLERQAPGLQPAPHTLVIETRGTAGVRFTHRGEDAVAPVDAVPAADTTGAGDALVAGVVAHLIRRPEDTAGAVRAGVRSSRALLAGRVEEEVAPTP